MSFTADNTNGSAATGTLQAVITLPSGASVVATGSEWNCTQSLNSATCTHAALAAGASSSDPVSYKVGFGFGKTCTGDIGLKVTDTLGESQKTSESCS